MAANGDFTRVLDGSDWADALVAEYEQPDYRGLGITNEFGCR